MGYTLGDIILAIIALVLFALGLTLLIEKITAQLYFFTLGPSQATAYDLGMRGLAAMATPGKVEMLYSNITQGVEYKFYPLEKVFCVQATGFTNIKTLDCISLPFKINSDFPEEGREASAFKLKIKKWFNDTVESAQEEIEWLG